MYMQSGLIESRKYGHLLIFSMKFYCFNEHTGRGFKNPDAGRSLLVYDGLEKDRGKDDGILVTDNKDILCFLG